MNIGYVRVSTVEQNLDRQLDKMRSLGISERMLFTDKATGKDFDRPGYQAMKQVIREGDTIFLDSLDRLGRNYDLIIKEWREITRELGADIVVLENAELFDSRKFKAMGDIGKLLEDQFLSMLAYVAEQELKKNHQRQREGLMKARERGVKFGRKPVDIPPNFSDVMDLYLSEKLSGREAQTLLGFKPATFYRRLREYKCQLVDAAV